MQTADLKRFYTATSYQAKNVFEASLAPIIRGGVYAPRATVNKLLQLAEHGDIGQALAKLDADKWPYSLTPVEWPCDKSDWIYLQYSYRPESLTE